MAKVPQKTDPKNKSIWHRLTNLPLLTKFIILIAVIAVIWFGKNKLFPSTSNQPQYQTDTVTKGTLVVSTSASGQVMSANAAAISTTATGVVSKVYVKDGDTVKAGQIVATINLDPAGQLKAGQAYSSYLSAKNSLASAQNALNSLQNTLFTTNQAFLNGAVANGDSTSDPTYIEQNATWLAAENNYKNQQQVIAAAEQNVTNAWLSYRQASSTVYAPISGTVTGFSLLPGNIVSANIASSTNNQSATQLADVVTEAPLTVSVNLSEIDVATVKTDDSATITFDSIPDKTFTGKVISVNTVGNTSSNVTSYPAVIALDTKDPSILPSMAATASIITSTVPDVLLAPSSAVTTQNGSSYLRVVQNGQVTEVPVEVGQSSATQTVITSGATEGETVVTSVVSTGTSTTSSGGSVFGGFGGRSGGGNVRFLTR